MTLCLVLLLHSFVWCGSRPDTPFPSARRSLGIAQAWHAADQISQPRHIAHASTRDLTGALTRTTGGSRPIEALVLTRIEEGSRSGSAPVVGGHVVIHHPTPSLVNQAKKVRCAARCKTCSPWLFGCILKFFCCRCCSSAKVSPERQAAVTPSVTMGASATYHAEEKREDSKQPTLSPVYAYGDSMLTIK